MCFALVAQLVEHTLGKGEVSSSNLLKSSITKADMKISAFVLSVVEKLSLGRHNGRPNFAFRSVAQLAERRSPKP